MILLALLVLWYHGYFSEGDPKLETYKASTYIYKEYQDFYKNNKPKWMDLVKIIKKKGWEGFMSQKIVCKGKIARS